MVLGIEFTLLDRDAPRYGEERIYMVMQLGYHCGVCGPPLTPELLKAASMSFMPATISVPPHPVTTSSYALLTCLPAFVRIGLPP